jgi:predicted RNase H-like nuclease (RuvC/YqgF family)
MKLFGKKETKLQKEMRKYERKLQKLNNQLDNFNAEVKLKSEELRKIGRV